MIVNGTLDFSCGLLYLRFCYFSWSDFFILFVKVLLILLDHYSVLTFLVPIHKPLLFFSIDNI